MKIALSVQNKLRFIDGSILKHDDDDLHLQSPWIRINNMVIYWILNLVSKEISASIIYVHSDSEIWIDLRDRFQQSNGPRIFQSTRRIDEFESRSTIY